MSIKDLAGLATEFASQKKPAAAPRSTSAPVALMEFSGEFKRLAAEREQLLARQGQPQDVALSQLVESPLHAQVRKLDAEQVDALAENLRSNPLATPIVVRRLEGGRLEIIAGRHRAAAFRTLGRETIPAVVVEMDDDTMARAIVFDNLVAPRLSDYERYSGIAQLRQRFGWSYTVLQEQTGFSRGWISALMQFERLPPAAHDVLREQSGLLTAAQLGELLKATEDEQALVQAVQRLREGEEFASVLKSLLPQQQRSRLQAQRTDVLVGNRRAATLSSRANTITIRLDKSLLGGDLHALQQRLADAVKHWAEPPVQ